MNKKENIDIWKDELKNSSTGFQTPEGYFDHLENEILNKTILSAEVPTRKIFSLNTWVTVGIASAAALIIAFVLLLPHSDNMPMELAYDYEMEYAYEEDDWIAQELGEFDIDDLDSFVKEEIGFLLEDGVTSDEILAAYLSE